MISIAALQLNSQDNIDANFAEVERLLQRAQQHAVSMVVLPENFACFAAGRQAHTAERFNELKAWIEQLAARYGVWIIAGTLPCPYRPDGTVIADGRVRATSLCIDAGGKTIARYDKIHLFDAQVADGVGRYRESATFEPGDQVVTTLTEFGRIGLMVCFDIRFAELAIELRRQEADILTAPSAFTYRTGEQHWHILLQARALDSQCLVLGAAQQGWHCGGKRQTWGHAMATDANGQVLAQYRQDGSGLIVVDFDKDRQQQIRQQMPLMTARRLSLNN